MCDYVIVGAGLAGAVCAERLAAAGRSVLVVERRGHVAGNAYDEYDEHGILVQRYGPHIFHTDSSRVFQYLSRFTSWRPYEHRVLASVAGQLVSLPLSLLTLEQLSGAPDRITLMASGEGGTYEEVMRARVGNELYELLYQQYSEKQWGCHPTELSADLAERIPVRLNRDARYFTDRYQAQPREGFTRLVERMLAHERIFLLLQTSYQDVQDVIPHRAVIYSGSIDEWCGYVFGRLPYRSARFEWETHPGTHQPVAVVNYPNTYDYTRVTEFKYLTGQQHELTTIAYEYPCDDGEPYWPMPLASARTLYSRYLAVAADHAARETPSVHFIGRLGCYEYLDMDQVVAQSLALSETLCA